MSKFGGGGAKCTICEKTAYPAETIQFEKKPYHVECFRCSDCSRKIEGAGKAAQFEDKLYCKSCFTKGGFAQKQKKVVWTKKESSGSGTASKFGGGGNPCTICAKTVYMAETLSFEKKIYHPECFKCSIDTCGKKMTASGAAAFEDAIFCKKCFTEKGYNRKQANTARTGGGSGTSKSNALASRFGGGGAKCPLCDKTVYPAEMVSYEKVGYHGDCFKCSLEACGKKMTPAGAAQFEGALFCTKCFQDKGYNRKQVASKSSGTSKSNALASKFGGGGAKCPLCDKTVYSAEMVSYEKVGYHGDCFKCSLEDCGKKMTPAGAAQFEGALICTKCFQDKGYNHKQANTKA